MTKAVPLAAARRLWLHAQRLDRDAPFGGGAEATRRAVEHLGYVQIDTINVIERCHHHILFTRIPDYARAHLHRAQSIDKTVFEHWGHALAYLPVGDFRHSVRLMREHRSRETSVSPQALRKVVSLVRRNGPLTLRDIDDDERVEKDHAWASRKPSERALRLAFYQGRLTVSARNGMLKTYELTTRHFGWQRLPPPASARATLEHRLDRALRTQAIVSLDSVCYLNAPLKAEMRRLIAARMRRKALVSVALAQGDGAEFWARPEDLEAALPDESGLVHILSPFDPLIIQRKRLKTFFGYEHLFEAYVPKEKRRLGYFALPVLVGDRIVAALDLKTDRAAGKLLMQNWTWIGKRSRQDKARIEDALARFERFQLAK